MTSASLQRTDRIIWLVTGVVALIDVAASIAGSFTIDWRVVSIGAGLCGTLAAAGYFYRHVRREEPIACICIAIAQMLSFSIVSVALSYIAAAAALPSWDATLMTWDKALGLDWMAWLHFMQTHPLAHLPLRVAYASLIAQPFVFVVALVALRKFAHLRIFIAGTVMTILIVVAISALLPAAGPGLDPPYAGPAPIGFSPASWSSWPVFSGLRDGTYRYLFSSDSDGIVQFPSYHAAAALLGIFAMWPVPYARWIALILNGAMIASTPVDGGHYFVDVFAGLLLAAVCWKAAAWMIAPQVSEEGPVVLTQAPSIVPVAANALVATPVQSPRSRQSDLNPV